MDGIPARQELGIATDDFVIGFSVCIERGYAIDDRIRALPALIEHRRNTRLLVVGGSPFTDYQQELKTLAQSLGMSDRVIFTGTDPYHKLPRYIASMDACTIDLPAPVGEFALPKNFFEYSVCGKSIVIRPLPDVEKTGDPHLMVYRTWDDFIRAIKDLMKNPVTYSLDLEKNNCK